MKTEFIDVSDTRKNLVVEIPSTVVDAEIDKVARDYSRAARIPGFRPGKVPPKVVRQRFRDQILHDVAHGLIPRAVDEALRERGVEPVNTPDIRDVVVEEGQPLKFTASFETVPAIDPGDYAQPDAAPQGRRRSTTRPSTRRWRACRNAPRATSRSRAAASRWATRWSLDLKRTAAAAADDDTDVGRRDAHRPPRERHGRHRRARPIRPGFDEALTGLEAGSSKTFDVSYPADYAVQELAGTTVTYDVTVKAIRTRVVPALDDELAKDLGCVRLARRAARAGACRPRARGAARGRARDARRLAAPARLARHLRRARARSSIAKSIAASRSSCAGSSNSRSIRRSANINWEEFRERQREAAEEAVRSALVLDEIARRDGLTATDEEMDAEIERYAERAGPDGRSGPGPAREGGRTCPPLHRTASREDDGVPAVEGDRAQRVSERSQERADQLAICSIRRRSSVLAREMHRTARYSSSGQGMVESIEITSTKPAWPSTTSPAQSVSLGGLTF